MNTQYITIKQYSRRFKMGEFRYATQAARDGDFIYINQTERRDNPKLEYRSSIILSVKDFEALVKALA